MNEPLWPTVLHWLRVRFGIKSVMECMTENEEPTPEEMGVKAIQALGHFMSPEDRQAFWADIEAYHKQQKEEAKSGSDRVSTS